MRSHHQPRNQSRIRFRRGAARILLPFENGQFNVQGLDDWQSHWQEPYYLLLTIPWSGFILIITGLYCALNALFACAYLLGGDGAIANAHPGSFWDAFFFSVQTLGAIGYGFMYPVTPYANILVAIEALTNILGVALVTGLAFARFSLPTVRVMFSDVAVVTPYDGVPTLMVRTANQRRNKILEAKLQMYFMRDEISAEGTALRRIYTLPLIRDHTPSFTLPWTVMHPIDEQSPLWGTSLEALQQTKSVLLVALTGVDETVAQALHARHLYSADSILWNRAFIDIFYDTEDGHRYIDFTHFHDVTS
ncbi:MAG: ion channel [Thermosynechococcaceae cyanobacterium]